MKKIILITLILFGITSYSQNTRDIVYLKNGSIIKGKITEMNPTSNLKIETSDGSLFVYKMDEILKMEKEEVTGNKTNENKTQTSVNISIVSSFFNNYFKSKRPALQFINVSKKNGVKREINGQKIYDIEYELLIEPIQDIFVSQMNSVNTNKFSSDFSYMLKQPTGWNLYMNADTKKINKGQRILAKGTMKLEETDNGWRVSHFNNKNYSTVSSSFVSKSMIEEQKNKAKAMAKKGDWKRTDSKELDLEPMFFKGDKVPLFGNSINKFEVKKAKYRCDNCRNDNVKDIERTIRKSFTSINRYSTSTESDFNDNENTTSNSIAINKILFSHLGIDKKGKDKGFSCLINYSISLNASFKNPEELTFNDTKTYTVKSNPWYFYDDKQSSFVGALKEIEKQMHKFVLASEPLFLNIQSFELDKKGNPKFIIFENFKYVFNIKKISFNIIERHSLQIKNGGFSMGKALGNVIYKRKDYPNIIKCEIKSSKLKKQLKNYINKKSELAGYSQ